MVNKSFVAHLEQIQKQLGKNVLEIDRFAPSSKTCSCCGYKLDKLPLRIRQWQYPNCKEMLDRDINAAIDIKAFALADVLGTRKCVKSSSTTIPFGDGVVAKDIDNNNLYGSHEAHSIA